MTVELEHIVVASLCICLYLAWKVYDLSFELDKLKDFSLKSIHGLAEAIDEIEDHLDDNKNS
jgi:hypothetical protein